MKLYQITDLTRLEEIREWIWNPNSRAHLIESYPSGEVVYQVTVDDGLGMVPKTPEFEQLFAGSIEHLSWPK